MSRVGIIKYLAILFWQLETLTEKTKSNIEGTSKIFTNREEKDFCLCTEFFCSSEQLLLSTNTKLQYTVLVPSVLISFFFFCGLEVIPGHFLIPLHLKDIFKKKKSEIKPRSRFLVKEFCFLREQSESKFFKGDQGKFSRGLQ